MVLGPPLATPSSTQSYKGVLGTWPTASSLPVPCYYIYLWQMSRHGDVSSPSARVYKQHMWVPAPLESPCTESTGIPATTCHPATPLQFSSMIETISSLPPLVTQHVPKELINRNAQEPLVFLQILTRSPATEASGISLGLITAKRALCFSDSPWEKIILL